MQKFALRLQVLVGSALKRMCMMSFMPGLPWPAVIIVCIRGGSAYFTNSCDASLSRPSHHRV